jgi:hypothetical protein
MPDTPTDKARADADAAIVRAAMEWRTLYSGPIFGLDRLSEQAIAAAIDARLALDQPVDPVGELLTAMKDIALAGDYSSVARARKALSAIEVARKTAP